MLSKLDEIRHRINSVQLRGIFWGQFGRIIEDLAANM